MAGYVGVPTRVGEIVSAPAHSLLVQSYKPQKIGKTSNDNGNR